MLNSWRSLSTGGRLVISFVRLVISRFGPACQDQVAGGHGGVGVVSMGGAPVALPTFATSEFQEFFRLGRALRVTLPAGNGGVVHLFVVYGYQGGGGGS